MERILLDPTEWLLLTAAAVTSIVIFKLLGRSLQSAISAVVPIVFLVFILQFAFGISPHRLLHDIMRLGHGIWHKFDRYLGVL